MMKLSDDIITTLVKQRNLQYDSYIATCREKIYQTNINTKTVTCYTIKGDKLLGNTIHWSLQPSNCF
jgi:hypothetical protein